MKKFALAAVAAAAMTGGVAQAYTVGTYSNGFVVPNLELVSNGTTAVGVINRTPRTVPVFWVFHGQDSEHKLDGCFTMTQNEYKSLVWGSNGFGDASVLDEKGYGVFSVGTGEDCKNAGALDNAATVSASAFQIDNSRSDVAFVPVIDGPLSIRTDHPLTALDVDSLVHVAGAADVVPVSAQQGRRGPIITARYSKGGGMSTRITVWSTGDHNGRHTVNIYDDKQNRTSTNFNLVHSELDHFNPATMLGSASFDDGFIEWHAYRAPNAFSAINANEGALALGAGSSGNTVNTAAPSSVNRVPSDVVGSVFVYSVVDGGTSGFNGTQTILGAHHR